MHSINFSKPIQFKAPVHAKIGDDNCSLSYAEFNQLVDDYFYKFAQLVLTDTVLLTIEQSVHDLALMLACFGQKKNAVFRSRAALIPEQLRTCDQIFLDQNKEITRIKGQIDRVSESECKIYDPQENITPARETNQQYKPSEEFGTLGFLSSGSVGEPKVILHRPQTLIANSQNALNLLPVTSEDSVLIPVPISHMYGLGAATLTSLCSGASIQLTQGLNLLKWRQIEKIWQPNCVFFTPTLLNAISAKISYKHVLKLIVTAGDCVSSRYLESWKNKTQFWLNLYGSTEMGVIGVGVIGMEELVGPSIHDTQDDSLQNSRQYFTPCPKVHVHSDEQELYLEHPYSCVGYLNKSVSLRPFKTGDLGHVREDGCFTVHGRSDFSVNRDGRLLAFAQLEIELKKHATVNDLVLVTGPEDSRGKTLIACCEGVSEEQLTTVKLLWQRNLPAYAVPSQLRVMDPLPRLANGKLNRRKLEEVISNV